MNNLHLQKPLSEAIARIEELRRLNGILGLLQWDQQTYMPERSSHARGEQIAFLSEYRHLRMTDQRFVDILEELHNERKALSEDEQCIIREVRRDVLRAIKIPATLVKELAQVESRSHSAWLQARREKNFAAACPELSKLLELKIGVAKVLQEEGATLYGTLLETYEFGLKEDYLLPLFARLKPVLQEMLRQHGNANEPGKAINGVFPLARQQALVSEVATKIGFDLSRGRIDATVHPFCSDMARDDVRLTTRYDETEILMPVFSLIHEAGHGMYEQGMRDDVGLTPLSESCSMAVHESQSLIWEKQVAHSLPFWEYFVPVLREYFPESFAQLSPEDCFRKVNRVSPALIRLKSDEVSYGLHIILRTELEQALIEGTLKPEELPAAWRQKCEENFGRAPSDDLEGVLQDTHWYGGSFGYFPTYLLGAIYAAHLFRAFKAGRPGAFDEIRQGNFEPLHSWLKEKIYSQGRKYLPRDLIERAAGAPPSEEAYLEYLASKF